MPTSTSPTRSLQACPYRCTLPGMTRTAIYTRISKDERDDRLGVDRQERLCREHAEGVGLDVVMVFTDNDTSAYARKRRAGFEQLVETLKNGDVDAVCVYHVDRLYRRT